ncbi:hypothetical protein A2U01_0088261, partial [Trifolium medium]|nr:hypothetical protein [Trifolium medium]
MGCSNKLHEWGRRKKTKFKEEIRECERELEELRGNYGDVSGRRYQE